MVQIAESSDMSRNDQPSHPQRISVGPADEVDSQAITRDSIDGEELRPSTLAGPPETASETVFNEPPLDDLAAPGYPDPPPASDAAADQEAPAALSVGWQSDRTRRARQIGLITTLSITGIVTAAVAFLFFVQRWKEHQTQLTQPAITAAESSEDVAEVSASEPSDDAGEEAAVEEAPAQNAASSPEQDARQSDDATEFRGDTPSGEPAQPTVVPEQDAAANSELAGTGVESDSGAAPSSELMPDSILGPLADQGDAADNEPANASPRLPPGLQKYTSLLGDGNDNDRAAERLEKPAAPDQVPLDQPAVDEETAFGPAKPIKISSRLQFEVAFGKKNAPLSLWLRILSQITGVPIALDVASLDAAGIAPTQAATPTTGWNAAETVLEAVAQSAGCRMRVTDAVVVIEADAEAVAAGIEPALQVDDLLAATENAEQRGALLQLIKRVTQAETVTVDPNTSKVSVDGDPSTAWLTALMLDGLRVARQLPPRLPRDRTQRWLAIDEGFDWPQVQGGQGIDAIDHPQPIISLIARVAEANDAAVVFAWGDLWQHGLTPESTAMPWTTDATGGEILDRMLEPYQLQVRQMSDGLWWVGSETLYDRDFAIGLIRVAGESGEMTIERLARSIGATDADELSVAFDASSGYLVAHLPRFLLRQLPTLVTAKPEDANTVP